MVYTARWSDELTPRDKKRDREAASKHEAAAQKIAFEFFQQTLGICSARAEPCSGAGHDPKVIRVGRQDGMFCVYHRGHVIRAQGDYGSLLSRLQEWRKANMSHAKIRADRQQHN